MDALEKRQDEVAAVCFDRLRDRGARVVATMLDPSESSGITGVVEIALRGDERRYVVEVSYPEPRVEQIRQRPPQAGDRLLLFRHASPAVSQTCRDLGLDYVDTAGNMLINMDHVLIDVEGRARLADPAPPPVDSAPLQPRPRTRGSAAYTRRGLQVTFALLADSALAQATQREIAAVSDASVGTVHAVLADLTEQGHLVSSNGVRSLVRGPELFDRWIDAYAVTLAPRLVLGRFEPADLTPWLEATVDLSDWDGLWGAESAAAVLGGWLRPGRATAYLPSVQPGLMRSQRLVPREDGAVEFRRRFWTDLPTDHGCAPTLLVYADLVISQGSRQREAAAMLRSMHDLLGSVRHR